MSYIGQRLLPENMTLENDPYFGGGTLIRRVIKKHGKENFKKEVLEICHSRNEADRLEEFYFQKFGVYTNPDKFYNIGVAGQFWRNENHSAFMSGIRKDYDSDPERKKQRVAKCKKMTVEQYEQYLIDKELKKQYEKKIRNINSEIKKCHKQYYLFMREQTKDERQKIRLENIKKKNIETWKEKKKDPEFLKAVAEGKKKVDYKKVSEKARSGRSKGHVKKNSIIYSKLWENNLSVNNISISSKIRKYLQCETKTSDGLKKIVFDICDRLKKDYDVIIDFNDLYKEAQIKYSGKLIK